MKILISIFRKHYKLMEQNDVVSKLNDDIEKVNRDKRNALFSYIPTGAFPFTFTEFANLCDREDRISKNLLNEKKKSSRYEEALADSYETLMNANVYEALFNTENHFSNTRFLSYDMPENPDNDILYDLVLNNELDLIVDHLWYKLNYDEEKLNGYAFFNHDYSLLEARTYNVA